ncbi:MAG: PaaI family thioesterase [Hyphomicrobiaceae bacterium]
MAQNVTPAFGVAPDETRRELPGLAFLEGIIGGRFPHPPICGTLEFALVEASSGFAAFQGTPTLAHINPFGTVHGGYAATLLDSCMTCAVLSTLERGQGLTTVEAKINFIRPLTEETGLVRAEGRVLHSGRRLATADGRLLDADGNMLAHATTTCLILAL